MTSNSDYDSDYGDIKELKQLAKEKYKASQEVKSIQSQRLSAIKKARQAREKPILAEQERKDKLATDRIIREAGSKRATQITQKLRADRLAKKEARVQELKDRYKRFKAADRQTAKVQRAISRVLNQKRREDLMSSGEMKQQYGQNYNRQNDGNLLHTPNLFTPGDGRDRSVRTNGNILSAPNYLLKTKDKSMFKQKWI